MGVVNPGDAKMGQMQVVRNYQQSILLTSGAVLVTTTWNPSDKSADITLSNGDLTATQVASDGSYRGVRAVASATTGKKYWEVHVDGISDTNPEVGLATAAASFTAFLGIDTNSIGWIADGRIFLNSSNVISIATWATNNTLCFAVDLDAALIWFRVGAGNWNNNGAADPVTGANGINISTMAAGGKYAIAQHLHAPTNAYTANFGATSYAQAVPSGYGNW